MYSPEKIAIKGIRLTEIEYESFKDYRKRVNHLGKFGILDKNLWKYTIAMFLLSGFIPTLVPIGAISMFLALGIRYYNNYVLKKSFEYERRMLREY